MDSKSLVEILKSEPVSDISRGTVHGLVGLGFAALAYSSWMSNEPVIDGNRWLFPVSCGVLSVLGTGVGLMLLADGVSSLAENYRLKERAKIGYK